MKITLENTAKIVMIEVEGQDVPARIWQGETEDGVPVHAYITRIVPEVPKDAPDHAAKTEQFDRELQECADARPTVIAIPARMII